MKHTTDLDASKVGQIFHFRFALPYVQHSVSSILNYLLTHGHYTAELSVLVWRKDCVLSSRHEEERVFGNDHSARWAVEGGIIMPSSLGLLAQWASPSNACNEDSSIWSP